jgi:uncharacterized protein YndB with AHSA1/START domain
VTTDLHPTAPDTATPNPEASTQTYYLFLKADPQAVWNALTLPQHSVHYLFGAQVETTGQTGEAFLYHSPDRSELWGDNVILDADPPRRLVVTYHADYDPELATEPRSRVAWLINPQADGVTLLTVVHDHLDAAPKTAARVAATGWMRVLSGLKTVLETSEGMTDPDATPVAPSSRTGA